MKIGIFGGSFNPPHIGHLIVIECVRDYFRFDKILFIPSAQPPNKHDSLLAPASCRLEMLRMAVTPNPNYEVSDIEIERKGISYTIDTITALAGLYPRASLSLIIGADNIIEFETWKSPDDILSKAELVVMSRPGFDVHPSKGKFMRTAQYINVPMIGISGTDIRRRIKLGHSIHYLVLSPVEEYIIRKRLYKD